MKEQHNPMVAVHVLPAMTFNYDGTCRTPGLAGKLIRKPPGAVKGYVTDTEAPGSASFAVIKDNRSSTTSRLGTGLNTLHSYARYLLVMRYTLPDFTITVGLAPRTILSLPVGSPRMTVNGSAKAIDAQGTKPLITNGTTVVPIRAIVESLGGSVSYDTVSRRSGWSGCGPREEVRLPACGWMHVIERCGQRNALDRWSNFMAWHGRIH